MIEIEKRGWDKPFDDEIHEAVRVKAIRSLAWYRKVITEQIKPQLDWSIFRVPTENMEDYSFRLEDYQNEKKKELQEMEGDKIPSHDSHSEIKQLKDELEDINSFINTFYNEVHDGFPFPSPPEKPYFDMGKKDDLSNAIVKVVNNFICKEERRLTKTELRRMVQEEAEFYDLTFDPNTREFEMFDGKKVTDESMFRRYDAAWVRYINIVAIDAKVLK